MLDIARRAKWRVDDWRQLVTWNGELPAPHIIKRRVVRAYRRRYDVRVLVETGTYRGDMAVAAGRWFDEVHTIELDATLAMRARGRLRRSTVHVYQGDSATLLRDVLVQLNAPALFWLDAHYSGGATARGKKDAPIEDELQLVLGHPCTRAILIDDAREFGNGDYPSLDWIHSTADAARMDMAVELDIIRLTRSD